MKAVWGSVWHYEGGELVGGCCGPMGVLPGTKRLLTIEGFVAPECTEVVLHDPYPAFERKLRELGYSVEIEEDADVDVLEVPAPRKGRKPRKAKATGERPVGRPGPMGE